MSKFQSTLPAWGATPIEVFIACDFVISIHAPRVGSDCIPRKLHLRGVISIHAPRVGSDRGTAASLSCGRHFNPRSPRGERPSDVVTSALDI